MNGYRISCQLGAAAFPATLDWERFTAAIVESPVETEILGLSVVAARERALAFPSGTAFGPSDELRWRRRSSGLHLVLLSDRGQTLEDETPASLQLIDDDRVVLWGEPVGGTTAPQLWYEQRIPREISYPVATHAPDRSRVALRIRRYRVTETGDWLWRYAGLEIFPPPAKGPQ